jgi:multiple sugar transport system substrate-binding protein
MTRAKRRWRATTSRTAALAACTALTLAACGGDDAFDDEPDAGDDAGATDVADGGGSGSLSVLIASSGDAETQAVTDATTAWSQESGIEVDVQVAQDIQQQLAQGFAGGSPPDLFYVDAGRFADYAEAGNLYAYGDQLSDVEDFYEPLRETFTYDGTQYCAPKDFSTLALQINTQAWEAAGLTDEDIPTTWEELQQVAEQLTTGNQVGLVTAPTRDRLGAFLVQNGGYWVNDDATEVTADEPQNAEALQYVQGLLESGVAAYAADLDAGWGGEAFGTGRAAMAMEGNWIRGAMSNDYPDVEYTVAELPEGPAGGGTLLFTQCWGMSAESSNQEAAVDLVEYLTSVEQQLANAEAFGVMPSRQSAEEQYIEQFPDDAPFIAGGEYGRGPVTVPGIEPVMQDLDAQLEQLRSTAPEQILQSFAQNAQGVLGQ